MKRLFSFMVALVAGLPMALPAVAATPTAGTLIKASGAAVYYYAADGKRYVFPNEKTYFTWYADFSTVQTITDAELAAIQIGGNVTYRPGARLVKITTDPKVYAVYGSSLRWVETEAVASTLFGATWNKQVDDIPDAFFVNYTVGASIPTIDAIPPAGTTPANVTIQWVIDGGEEGMTPDNPDTTPDTPSDSTDLGVTLTADKTEAQVREQVQFLAKSTATGSIASFKILQPDGTLVAGCGTVLCSGTWTVPTANVQDTYTFRAILTLQDGRVDEATATVSIVSLPTNPLIRITTSRPVIKPAQYPDIHALVDIGLSATSTTLYINNLSVKVCTITPTDCPYNDYLLGEIGTAYDIYAVIETPGQLFYKSETVRLLVAANDTPSITLTPSLSPTPAGQPLGMTLTAQDDDGISRTEIRLNGDVLKSCQGPTACAVSTGPWNVASGTVLSFVGHAWDLQNAESSSTLDVVVQ